MAASLPPVVPGPLLQVAEQEPPAPQTGQPDYRRLTARACQELAVRNSGAARLLDGDVADPVSRRGCGGSAKRDALRYAADEARNRAAGDALELYAKLAAAEAGNQVYRAAEIDLERLLAEARRATAAGLKEPADVADLDAQLADVRADRLRAEGGAREVNHGLKALLGLPPDPAVRLWPDSPEVRGGPGDAEEAVRVGLYYRPDLLLLRSLLRSPDPAAPEVARQALGGVSPLLGELPSLLSADAGPVVKLVAACAGLRVPNAESDGRTARQLGTLLAEREKQAEAEIRAAVDHAAALAARARTYADSAGRLRVRVAELEKAEAVGRATGGALAKTKAALWKTDGDVVTTATEYQAALAKLKQAQGVLVREVLDPTCPPPPAGR